jgi:hypothetical protein
MSEDEIKAHIEAMNAMTEDEIRRRLASLRPEERKAVIEAVCESLERKGLVRRGEMRDGEPVWRSVEWQGK